MNNPKDPMLKIGPEVERALMEAFGKVANGHDHATVINAAMMLVVNGVRQNFADRASAERFYDDLVGRARNLLLEQHYDAVTGKRRNIFPYTQVIHATVVR